MICMIYVSSKPLEAMKTDPWPFEWRFVEHMLRPTFTTVRLACSFHNKSNLRKLGHSQKFMSTDLLIILKARAGIARR